MFEYTVISEQGRRFEMEDAHIVDINFNSQGWLFAGVYDGHGGEYASLYAVKHLHQVFLNLFLIEKDPQAAFSHAYENISQDLAREEDLGRHGSGATAATCFIKDNILTCANAGDARILLVRKKDVLQLSVDHRVDNTEEKERILASGGQVVGPYASGMKRPNWGLMPTRTLGDEWAKEFGVISAPYTVEHRIKKDDLVLVIGCDGLFDTMTNKEVADIVRASQNLKVASQALRDEVLDVREGTDNLTMILINLAKEKGGK